MNSWRDNWTIIKKLNAGGQGQPYIVAPHIDTTRFYFLKELLKDSDKMERRERFYREVSCYQTLDYPQIPKLIESNKEDYGNKKKTPYLITEYICGDNLQKFVHKHTYLKTQEAFGITLKLLETLHYTFLKDTVHRDIKPDNVIVRNNDPSDPVLVDFGMAFYEGEDLLTPGAQQIGNRFLRLPEFSPGSTDKRSPKSDLTLCVGLLFFMLTGIAPRELKDHNGEAPHQTASGRLALSRHSDVDIIALKSFFDRAFEQSIHWRWDSASSVIDALKKIKISPNMNNDELSASEMIIRIRSQMESHEELRRKQIHSNLEKAYEIISSTLDDTVKHFSDMVQMRGNTITDVSSNQKTGFMGIVKLSDHASGYTPDFVIKQQGEEIVINIGGTTLHRSLITNLEKDQNTIAEKYEKVLLAGLTKIFG